jgi:hypothetical protein
MTERINYEPPTFEEWNSIVQALQVWGYAAHLEGGGAGATHIWIDLPDGRVVLLGDNGDLWATNIYSSREAFESGESFTEIETDVPTHFDGTDRYHDPESIADGLHRAVTDVCIAGGPALAGCCGEPDCVCNPLPATDVFGYFAQKLKKLPWRSDGKDDIEGLKQFPLDSQCGRACTAIIDKTAELLAICDPHTDIVEPIVKGAQVAVEIVCFG